MLALSEVAGAATQMTHALVVNPFGREQMATAIRLAEPLAGRAAY